MGRSIATWVGGHVSEMAWTSDVLGPTSWTFGHAPVVALSNPLADGSLECESCYWKGMMLSSFTLSWVSTARAP